MKQGRHQLARMGTDRMKQPWDTKYGTMQSGVKSMGGGAIGSDLVALGAMRMEE